MNDRQCKNFNPDKMREELIGNQQEKKTRERGIMINARQESQSHTAGGQQRCELGGMMIREMKDLKNTATEDHEKTAITSTPLLQPTTSSQRL